MGRRHERTAASDHSVGRYVRHERRCGSFSRTMTLPAGVDAKQIKASTHDGVIEVTIPLPQEAQKETITITPTAG